MTPQSQFWIETLAHGVAASVEQIAGVASDMEGCHNNYGMAFGHDCIPNPLELELRKTKKKLEIESSKRDCKRCGGSGRIFEGMIGGRWSDSQCGKCHGEGKI